MQFSMESGKRAVLVMNLNISMEYLSFQRGDPCVRSSGSTTIDGGGWQAQAGFVLGGQDPGRGCVLCVVRGYFRLPFGLAPLLGTVPNRFRDDFRALSLALVLEHLCAM